MADPTTLSLQDRGPTVLAVVIALLCVSTAFIVIRLISRIGVVKRVSNDDYAIVIAWVSHIPIRLPRTLPVVNTWQFVAFGFSFSICHGTSVGLGRHEADIAPQDRGSLRKAEYAFSVLYVSGQLEIFKSKC